MAQKSRPYCPNNGSHGATNGAAPSFPIDPCKHCGQDGLTNFHNYCPNCFMCFTCDRIIKRAMIPKKWEKSMKLG